MVSLGGFQQISTLMKKFTFLLVLTFLATALFAQDYDAIADAVSDGNASALGRMFDASVEFSQGDELSTLGRSDAENRMRTFFMDNEPKHFEIVHKGESKSDVHYCMGQLITSTGGYRLTLYLRRSIDTYLIQSIEIEHE